MALLNAVNGFTHFKNYQTLYENSYLQLLFPTAQLAKDALKEFFSKLGETTTGIDKYFKLSIESSISKKFALAELNTGKSDQSDLSFYGNKHGEVEDNQTIIVLLDIETKLPVASRAINVDGLDKAQILEFLNIVPIKDSVLILNNGDYSEEKLSLLKNNGNHFILPLQNSLATYKEATKDLVYDNKFIYESDKIPILINSKTLIKNSYHLHIFQDSSKAKLEEIAYLKHLKCGDDGYSLDELHNKALLFGSVVLLTDLDSDALEIYSIYKEGNPTETMIKKVNKELDYSSIELLDYYQKNTASFILLLVMSMLRLSADKLSSSLLTNSYSLKDVLIETSCLKLESQHNKWTIENIKPKNIQLYNELGIPLTYQ
jgi:hypothetical protein